MTYRETEAPKQPEGAGGRPPLVLYVVTLSEWGGAQRYVYDLATRLGAAGFSATVACAPGGPLVDRLRAAGVPVHEVPELVRSIRPLTDLRALWKLYRLIRRLRPDIVHCNSSKAGILGRLATWLAGVPVRIFTAHGWAFTEGRPHWQRWLLARTEALVAPLTHRIICVSEHDQELAVRCGVAPPERLVTIHNGVDPVPLPTDSPAGSTGPAPQRPLTIIMVARLAPPKDPVLVLEGLGRLPGKLATLHADGAGGDAETPLVRLILVGDGPLRPEVEADAAALGFRVETAAAPVVDTSGGQGEGAACTVILPGERPADEVPRLLAQADLFVLASRWEGLPYSIIEAMMTGLPVVASRVGGIPEMVEDGVTGFLVPPGDADAMAAALARFLADPTLCGRMGEAARQRAQDHFTVDRMVAATAALYGVVVKA